MRMLLENCANIFRISLRSQIYQLKILNLLLSSNKNQISMKKIVIIKQLTRSSSYVARIAQSE